MFIEKIHRYFFLFGIISLAFGMMMGTVPTSVPQFILLGNWLLEGKFKNKWLQLKSNKLFWILSSVFLIHVLGLFYTQEFAEGIKDVKTKMPLMFLPIIFFSSKPLSLKEFHVFLYFFIAGTIVNTLWCLTYSFVLHQNETVRNASRFMSHIRLGLYLDMAIAACVYNMFLSKNKIIRLGLGLVIFYFIYVLYALGLATGIFNFIILVGLSLLYFIYKQKTSLKIVGLLILIAAGSFVSLYVLKIKNTQLTLKDHENNFPKKMSVNGRTYFHSLESKQKENGYLVVLNIQPVELQHEWKRRFPKDSFNFESKHNLKRYEVLLRYLSSLGLTKDSAAISRLTETDFENIQKGKTNFQQAEWSFLHRRVYEFVNEYDEFKNHGYVNGHSMTMRFYFWKAALLTIEKHPIFGVGTGDVQVELNKVYVESKSPLEVEWYKRPHNQYLTIVVALGIVGLVVFLFSLFYPILYYRNYLPVLFWPFSIMALASFFMEDTLETQAGLSFYAVFNTLFFAMAYWKQQENRT